MGGRAHRFWAAGALLAGLLACLDGAAAIFEIRLSNNRFTPNSLSIDPGDTVVFVNTEGFHDVQADDGSYGNIAGGPGWSYARVYSTPGVYGVYCSLHSKPGAAGMNARITVRGTAFAISQGLNGAWVNPNTLGQGFLLDFQTSNSFMFGAWFTYETGPAQPHKIGNANHRWLTMQGNYAGDRVDVLIHNTSGGVFNTPGTTTTTQVGTGTLTFSSCTSGTFNFTLTDPPMSGTIPLSKALAPFGTGCGAEAPEAGEALR